MSNPFLALLRPPTRLRPLSDRAADALRPLWILSFGLAVLVVVVSAAYAIRASHWVQPVVERHGLDFVVTTDGKLLVGTLAKPGSQPVPPTAKVVAVNGRRVPADLKIADFATSLDTAPGPQVEVILAKPDGGTVRLVQSRGEVTQQSGGLSREVRFWARLSAGLIACSTLLACSLLLALRRPNDPVAMLLAFAFVGMAATIDPPLQFWMWTDRMVVSDVVATIFFCCLVVGLAAFPDGVFIPRYLRWVVPLSIPLAVFVSIPGPDEDLQGIVGVMFLLAIVAGQVIRFRRQPTGIARQQIKWAGFGFFVGLVLILGAVLLAATISDPSQTTPLLALTILLLFSVGMAAFPLGLLIALTRFRLWEADTVITRSAAYAVVTVIVGVVWAASSDLVKLVISEFMGRESEAGATTVGAIIAAGIFSPTQSAVLGWTRKRFGGPVDRIRGAAERLKNWGMTERPAEVASRALGIIDQAVHPAAAAVLLRTEQGMDLVAAQGVQAAGDARLVESLPLDDEEGPVGTLRLGRRSDGNRYNRQELEAVRQLIPHLADALRVARDRYSRETVLQQQIEATAARLAQLEGGTPKPA